MLLTEPTDAIGALYIAPIKALLNNQAERLGLYTEMVALERQVWHGDTSSSEKQRFVQQPTELLMTTPESLEVMLVSSRVPTPRLLADLRMVVIDEIHAMAGNDLQRSVKMVKKWEAAFESDLLDPADGAHRYHELRERERQLRRELDEVVPLRTPPS